MVSRSLTTDEFQYLPVAHAIFLRPSSFAVPPAETTHTLFQVRKWAGLKPTIRITFIPTKIHNIQVAITLRMEGSASDLIDKLIKHRPASSRADALRWFMQSGMQSAKKTVKRKEKSQAIIKVWKKRGFPELPNDLSESSIKERD